MIWTEPAFEAVVRLLGVRTGLVFAPGRRSGVEQGIRRAMGRARVADPECYREWVERDDALFDDLVGELTIGETYFFREPAQFQFLRETILPEFHRRCCAEQIFRAWSAGCASGEEAYSLAMVFAEEGLADRVHLLGTDVSPVALTKARRGSYGPWSLRGEGAAVALPHLDRHGERLVVKEPIRRKVAFTQLNLALDVYPSFASGTWGLDLIFCRNVLIYFNRETVRAVAGRLFAALSQGGWLLTASSDPPLGEDAPFETVATEQGVFYRKGIEPPALSCSAATVARTEPASEPWPWSEAVVADEAPPGPGVEGVLDAARDDMRQGQYARAAERVRVFADVAEAAALRVRALANLDPGEADRACAEAIVRHPLSTELYYLSAVLLHGLGRDDEAARTARRTLYLDRSLASAHFLLGTILRRKGDRAGAWRAFRNARDLCAAEPASELVPLSDGEPAGRLAEAAALQMAWLEPAEVRP